MKNFFAALVVFAGSFISLSALAHQADSDGSRDHYHPHYHQNHSISDHFRGSRNYDYNQYQYKTHNRVDVFEAFNNGNAVLFTHDNDHHFDFFKKSQYEKPTYNHQNKCNLYPKQATYYSREVPVYRYALIAPPQKNVNQTYHQPPYAYSSCAGKNCCQDCKPARPWQLKSLVGYQNRSYRAPSEYNPDCYKNRVYTPNAYQNYRHYDDRHRYQSHSPYKTHKTYTCDNC